MRHLPRKIPATRLKISHKTHRLPPAIPLTFFKNRPIIPLTFFKKPTFFFVF
jgi:hypothetical protein